MLFKKGTEVVIRQGQQQVLTFLLDSNYTLSHIEQSIWALEPDARFVKFDGQYILFSKPEVKKGGIHMYEFGDKVFYKGEEHVFVEYIGVFRQSAYILKKGSIRAMSVPSSFLQGQASEPDGITSVVYGDLTMNTAERHSLDNVDELLNTVLAMFPELRHGYIYSINGNALHIKSKPVKVGKQVLNVNDDSSPEV